MERADYIKQTVCGFKAQLDYAEERKDIEYFADNFLVTEVARVMRDKLARSRAKGHYGWWNDQECTVDRLLELLKENLDKGEMANVINLAAMIHVRQQSGSIKSPK